MATPIDNTLPAGGNPIQHGNPFGDHGDTKGFSGLRAQILDNVRVAFPSYYHGTIPMEQLRVIITLGGGVFNPRSDIFCIAEVVWGPHSKVFLQSDPYDHPKKALEALLLLSMHALAQIKEQYQAGDMSYEGEKLGRPGGWMITSLNDDVPVKQEPSD